MGTQWHREIADQINHLNDDSFPDIFFKSLKKILSIDLILIVVFQKEGNPALIFNNFPQGRPQKALARYIYYTYVLDPFYRSFVNGIDPGIHSMVDLAPDGFFDSAYCKQHNVVLTNLEEGGFLTPGWPSYLNEIGLFLKLPDGNFFVISLFRKRGACPFSELEIRQMKDLIPVINALFCHHYRYVVRNSLDQTPETKRTDEIIKRTFDVLGKPELSNRESSIMQMILQGHSTESIGFQLNISPMTVKTHRRNSYSKLSISSQAELLSFFLDSLVEQMGD